MKRILSILLCVVLVLSIGIIGVSADDAAKALSTEVYVTIADSEGKTAVAGEKITVTDTDSDGALTINDVLYTAHEQFYDGGAAAGYGTSVTEYGLGLTKLWGTANGGSYSYYVNNASAWALTDPVEKGDYIAAFVYTDPVGWSDHYSYFDRLHYLTAAGKTLTLSYIESGYDAEWNPVSLPVAGAVITINGKATNLSTNEDGKAFLTFSEPGVYRIGATVEGKRLVAPVGIVEVKEAGALIGDADLSGDVTILDATHIQRYLVALVTEEEIDLTNADADRSGDITILDATAIQRYLAGIESEL